MVIMYEVKYWFSNGDFGARYFTDNPSAYDYACSMFDCKKVCIYMHLSGKKTLCFKKED